MSTALGRIGQIAIPVADLERAVAFYGDALGIPFLFRAPPDLAFLDCGGVRLMLAGPGAEGDGGGDGGAAAGASTLYFVVDDLAATHAALADRGVTFEREPHLIARLPDHELWMAFFRDPDGHLLALMSEVRE